MSSPSFLVRLRSRNRRLDTGVELPGSEHPEDHWHAGDPRMLDGTLALQGTAEPVLRGDVVPVPRRPVDMRRELSVVPPLDVSGAAVVDLRHDPASTGPRAAPMPMPTRTTATTTAATAATAGAQAARAHTWTESSTWLG